MTTYAMQKAAAPNSKIMMTHHIRQDRPLRMRTVFFIVASKIVVGLRIPWAKVQSFTPRHPSNTNNRQRHYNEGTQVTSRNMYMSASHYNIRCMPIP